MNIQEWKAETIFSIFSRSEATRIMQIPLTTQSHDDFLVWGGEHQVSSRSEAPTNYYKKTILILYNLMKNSFTTNYGVFEPRGK